MPSDILQIPESDRKVHTKWLCALTSLPTATGCEQRVVSWIERWCADRDWAALSRDASGNLTITNRHAESAQRPIYFTAHLDHPAFVVESIVGPGTVSAQFRGGVLEPYFVGTAVLLCPAAGDAIAARVVEYDKAAPPERMFPRATLELDSGSTDGVQIGDCAIWDLPETTIDAQGMVRARVCDDLAAAAAALAAMDRLATEEDPPDVRLLFTLAEEVGFVGAIAACRHNTMPKGARLIALENSRAMPEAPIGAGPIVRVGDRLSTFSPTLTAAVARVAQKLANIPEQQVGSKVPEADSLFSWQRKLMPGGACEASAFSAFGYEATCVCLPLGNYHNMGDLDRVQQAVKAKEKNIKTSIEPECIALADFEDLVLLLVGCGKWLADAPSIRQTMDKLFAERSFVLQHTSMERKTV